MFRTTLVATAIAVAAPAYAQIRVITGDVEHVYGQGGQLLDDEALQRQNARMESARMERRRQEELLSAEQARQAAAQAAPSPRAIAGCY